MSAVEVYGRRAEIEMIDAVFRSVERGDGAAAVTITAGAGFGKTALLGHVVDVLATRGVAVLRTGLTEPEQRLAWAGLHGLCRGIDDDDLVVVHEGMRGAIPVALGRRAGGTDASLVAFAFGELLAAQAALRPVVLVIDDLHWLDQATAAAVAFAIRATSDRPVLTLVATRPDHELPLEPTRLLGPDRTHELGLGGVSPASIHHIVEDRCGATLRRPDLIRLHEATGGSPLHAIQAAQLIAAGADPGAAIAHPSLPAAIASRLEGLSEGLHRLLAAVALTAAPDLALLRRLEPDLDVEEELRVAEGAEILRVDQGSVAFRHPLIRNGVFDRLGGMERIRLARRAADLVADPDERAELLADAATEPDEHVAAAMAAAAARAAERGATHVAADRYERAARLTPEEHREDRGRRFLLAAEAADAAGDRFAPLDLAASAAELLTDWHDRLRIAVVGILAVGNRPDRKGAAERTRAALAEFDQPLALARLNGLLSQSVLGTDIRAATAYAAAAVAAAEAAGDADRLAIERNRLVRARFIAGEPIDLDSIERQATDPSRPALERIDLAYVLVYTERLGPAIEVLEAALEEARRSGAIDDAQIVHDELGEAMLRAGRLREAEQHWLAWAEIERLIGGTDPRPRMVSLAVIQALTGRLAEARAVVEAALIAPLLETTDEISARSSAVLVALTAGDWSAVVEHGRRDRTLCVAAGYGDLTVAPFRAELVEGLVHLGELDEADEVAAELETLASRTGQRRGLVESRRARALVHAARGDSAAAIASMEEAIALHDGWPVPFEHGRNLLALGSMLRRAGRRSHAAERLGAARALFDQVGAIPWTARADAELERVGSRRGSDDTALTPTERQIAERVAAGRTNAEVASELSVSVRTVESNLTRVYRKLGVRSRTELVAALAGGDRG